MTPLLSPLDLLMSHSTLVRPSLLAVLAAAGFSLAACDHAQDLVDQGKKQAADIQKSIEGKARENTVSSPASTATPPDGATSPATTVPPSASVTPPQQPVTPAPQDYALLVDQFMKLEPVQKTDSMLHELGSIPEEYRARLTECDLTGSNVTDAGLLEVAKFPNLVLVSLTRCTHIKETSLAALVDLQHLEVLLLERCAVSNDGVSHLRKLTNLRVLNLNQTSINDAGIAGLAPLSRLEELSINSTKIDGSGFRKVPWAASLRVLQAGGSMLGQELDVLKGYRKLEELNLYGAHVTDKTVGALKGHSQLRVLHLSENGLSDVGAKKLTGLASLEVLSLNGNRVSDNCLATFKVCRKLTLVADSATMITSSGREFIKKFAPQCAFIPP
jgi:Leucine rich repeat